MVALRAGLAVVVLFACGSACTRGARTDGAVADAAGGAGSSTDAALAGSTAAPAAIFSAPIAGARVPGGDVIAAGLVVLTHAITAERIDASGRAAWTRSIVPDVAWLADAELHAWPIVAGAAFVWRGPVAGKSGHVAIILAPDGHVVDGPLPVGSLVCAMDDGLAWSEGAPGGASHVHARRWSGTPIAPHDEVGAAIADDFTLTCGAHRAYAIVEGDETTPTRVFATGDPGTAASPFATIPPLALGRDEERDLFPWAEGDELGLVRVASGGAVQAADVSVGGIAPLHADRMRVPPEDDVVAVDADARQVVLVTTHDESDACPDGRGGSSVQALRLPRQGGAATTLRIAPAACGKDVGPFWTNLLGRSVIVGWSERASRAEKKSAAITGLAFRALEEGAATGHVVQAADAIADAECDETRCYAVALVREPGTDGMTPEAMKILTYPPR